MALAILVGAGLAYVLARETPLFALRRVAVEGAPPPVAAQARVALAPLRSSSLVGLDGEEVVRRLEALPTVVSARYDRDFPHTLKVWVRPEEAVGILRRGSEAWLLSARGRLMRRLEPRMQPTLPRVWVERGAELEVGGFAGGTAGRIADSLAVLASSPIAGRVTTARSDGRLLVLVLRSGVELRLGREAQLALKLAAAARILNLAGRVGPGSYVDLSVAERPVGRLYSQVEG